jgi:hypothetical protein
MHAVFNRYVKQVLIFQPLREQLQTQGEFTPPCTMLIKFFVERSSQSASEPADKAQYSTATRSIGWQVHQVF